MLGTESGTNAPVLLKRTFSPLRINGLELKNRILMSSMHLHLEGPEQFDRLAQFYRLRAQGGPGLIVTAGCSPNLAGREMVRSFSIDSDDLIEGHRRIVSAVRSVGHSKLALQLFHAGREAFHGYLVAPSAVRAGSNLFAPQELSPAQIEDTIADYGRAARRALEAGYDAIEILFSQGFLVHQFLSAHTNGRDDEWGGTFENRQRFAVAVAKSVRDAVGPSFPLVFRVPCLDLVANGLSFDQSMSLIGALESCQIDLLNVGIGWHEATVPTIAATVPQAGFASIAARVKNRFPHLLTCVGNRINDLRQAEELLIEGVADMVAMGRPFLADRDIVGKSMRGQFSEVRPCLACNEDCLDRALQGQVVGCSVNPECCTAAEGEPPPMFRGTPKIAVVGGGLAGLSSAWTLARRGADVTLYESGPSLGGQIQLACKIPGKEEYSKILRYFENVLASAGVSVCVSHEFGLREIELKDWDHVMVAVGTRPRSLGSLDHDARVIGYRDLLQHDLPIEYPVVIIGGGGVALDTARYLLARESRVDASESYLARQDIRALVGRLDDLGARERPITIIQRSTKKVGYRLGRTARWIALKELERGAVGFIRGASILGCGEVGVKVRVADEERSIPARTIILAAGQCADTSWLQDALTCAGIPFSVVGAARGSTCEPSGISSSIRSGCAQALELDFVGDRAD